MKKQLDRIEEKLDILIKALIYPKMDKRLYDAIKEDKEMMEKLSEFYKLDFDKLIEEDKENDKKGGFIHFGHDMLKLFPIGGAHHEIHNKKKIDEVKSEIKKILDNKKAKYDDKVLDKVSRCIFLYSFSMGRPMPFKVLMQEIKKNSKGMRCKSCSGQLVQTGDSRKIGHANFPIKHFMCLKCEKAFSLRGKEIKEEKASFHFQRREEEWAKAKKEWDKKHKKN